MLYALVDRETLIQRDISLQEHLTNLRRFQIPILQYRNKIGNLPEKRADLLTIRQYYKGTLIINDTIELIDMADGLHVGQEDIATYSDNPEDAIRYIRQKIGDKLLGLSTHNLKEIEQANRLDIDYIGLGAYRPTDTKKSASVGGEALLELAKASTHPVAIIGGVRLNDDFDSHIKYKVIGSGLYSS
ncbi:Thiamin-phosphate pyrophosphorylase [hydrothermal vent metagenome]|uniref:Thiamin-phosphate pyrophosphorylase n=1 Tax=hydrothermal vent metagenome TaxID=652676 RepID=A0A1W1C343_9ZZZZ